MSKWLQWFAQKIAISLGIRNDAYADQSEGNLTLAPLSLDSLGNLRVTQGMALTVSATTGASTISVTNASQVAALANNTRKSLTIMNNGSNVAYWYPGPTCSSGASASTTGGGLIPTSSGVVIDHYAGEVSVIAPSGNTVLFVAEFGT